MNIAEPHRPGSISKNLNDRIEDPAWPPSPTPPTRDRTRWRIADAQSSQLLGQIAQRRLDLLVR
jgi:hypothetical protein